MSDLQRPAFLQKCLIKNRVIKTRHNNHTYYASQWFFEPLEAYYIGWRVVHEGMTYDENEYYDYGGGLMSHARVFERETSFIVYQFVINERRNIILAKPEDVKILEAVQP